MEEVGFLSEQLWRERLFEVSLLVIKWDYGVPCLLKCSGHSKSTAESLQVGEEGTGAGLKPIGALPLHPFLSIITPES